MIQESIKFALIVYAISAVIAFLVAGLIKVIFVVINHGNNKVKKVEKVIVTTPVNQGSSEV